MDHLDCANHATVSVSLLELTNWTAQVVFETYRFCVDLLRYSVPYLILSSLISHALVLYFILYILLIYKSSGSAIQRVQFSTKLLREYIFIGFILLPFGDCLLFGRSSQLLFAT
jgi:hypothetical protein